MELYHQLGQQSLMSILMYFFFIAISFYAIQSVRLDQIFKKGMSFQIQLMYILLSIVIGSAVANFFIDFLNYSKSLQYLF
jgi:uncharacterized integral membrane protein (TIGR02327 family)